MTTTTTLQNTILGNMEADQKLKVMHEALSISTRKELERLAEDPDSLRAASDLAYSAAEMLAHSP